MTKWSIEHASTPRHVRISFVISSEVGDATARSTTRHFVLPNESAAELINELKGVLEDCAAFESLGGEQSVVVAREASGGWATQDDADPMSNHFALGAYGLVGN